MVSVPKNLIEERVTMYIRASGWTEHNCYRMCGNVCQMKFLSLLAFLRTYMKCQSDCSGSGCSKSGDITSVNQMSHLKCAPLPCIYVYI